MNLKVISRVFAVALAAMPLTGATADASDYVRVTLAKGGSLKPNTLYAIETRCSKKLAFPDVSKGGLFPNQTYAISHAVVVSNGSLAAAVDLTKLPATVISFVLPFSVNTAITAAGGIDNRENCDANFLIEGPSSLFLTPLFSVAKTTNPGTINDAANSLLSLTTSLAPVIGGGPLAPGASKTLGGIVGAVSPLQSLFQDLFPSGATTDQKAWPLQVGTSTVETHYSEVKVTVRPIKSIATDENPVYFSDFNKAINALTLKDSASCPALAGALAEAGFTSTTDRAYALGRLAVKTLSPAQDVAHCLQDLCAPAIAPQMDAILWNGISAGLRPTNDDCDNVVPPPAEPFAVQPSFSQVAPAIIRLVTLYGQYFGSPTPPAAFAPFADRYMAKTLAIDDRTSGLLFNGKASVDPKGFFDYLKAQKFERLGCYAAVANPALAYNSVASFVAAKRPDAASSATAKVPLNGAIVLYPLWQGGRIAEFVASDDPQGILASVGTLTSCGGFQIVSSAPAKS
jgi:hypothetical protein